MNQCSQPSWSKLNTAAMLHDVFSVTKTHCVLVYISINKNLMILVLFKMIGTMGLCLSLLGFHLGYRDLKIIDI